MSPLFDSLRRAMRIATLSARDRRGIPVDELIDIAEERRREACSRRRFVKESLLTAAAAASGTLAACRRNAPAPGETRIVIVGAGIAGLNAAYTLQKARLHAKLFEASDRIGGRIFTAVNLLGEGLTTELGGEFINSTHEEMLALMEEFGLERLDTQGLEAASWIRETYLVEGRQYTRQQAAREFVEIAGRVAEDYASLGDVVNYQQQGGAATLDRMPMAAYLDAIGAGGWMRKLLEVAYVTEYGLETGEQSALNFILLIGTGDLVDSDAFQLVGESDERYKCRGGNQRIVDELARRLEQRIYRGHRLEAIRSRGDGFTLTFQDNNGSPVEEEADVVFLALPFTLLREVEMSVELPAVKRRSIQELGYGTNAKVLVGFKTRHWQELGYTGRAYSDEPFQAAWDNSFLQAGTEGGLTLYSGGRSGLEVGQGTAAEAVEKLVPGLEKAYPGISRQRNGRGSRFHWPTFPWTKGSYCCYKPGQWTTIGGAEGVPVGNLYFVGEHCSVDFQGYMNGAAQSGKDAAEALIARLNFGRDSR